MGGPTDAVGSLSAKESLGEQSVLRLRVPAPDEKKEWQNLLIVEGSCLRHETAVAKARSRSSTFRRCLFTNNRQRAVYILQVVNILTA